ncbi:MAG: sigma-70 family RNA polymerase sigma factor [Acidimicrobiales bacterium]|nr:sigma-70 family RNA polymerase sigma factor [Acidimicrobiales bacterium]
MTGGAAEGLLRELAPQVLGAVVRRYGNFASAEDAVQEALLAAATQWPVEGEPDNPRSWLIRVASRRMVDQFRRDDARRTREDLAASWSRTPPDPPSERDDTLILMIMCCHPSLSPASAIPLALRAVGGLTTREIAAAFLVPEATMAQRISRAKVKASDEPFGLPEPDKRAERMRSVLHVLYLLFNEGYASSSGPDLSRTDLSGEAIRLARGVRAAVPEDPEVAGLLALMVLTDARRPARTRADGELVPLAEQERTRWDRGLISEGVALITEALRRGQVGEYQVQAAIAAVHDQAASYGDTDWPEILSLYGLLERMTGNPMVTLNKAVATAMVQGPGAGLALLDGLDERLGDHHRIHSVRAHLLEQAGDTDAAVAEFRDAARRTTNLREQHYLTTEAARLATERAHD